MRARPRARWQCPRQSSCPGTCRACDRRICWGRTLLRSAALARHRGAAHPRAHEPQPGCGRRRDSGNESGSARARRKMRVLRPGESDAHRTGARFGNLPAKPAAASCRVSQFGPNRHARLRTTCVGHCRPAHCSGRFAESRAGASCPYRNDSRHAHRICSCCRWRDFDWIGDPLP